MLRLVLSCLVVLFPISEVALALKKRSAGEAAQGKDRGSLRLLWLSVALGLGLATAARCIPATRLGGSPDLVRLLALCLLSGGLTLRWAAILTLGRLFTVDVAIHPDHVVVEKGLYRLVRHPSYTGLYLAFLGLGLFFANWLSIVGLLFPITLALINRVVKEESALLASLGSEYADYCARSKRFIPWLF